MEILERKDRRPSNLSHLPWSKIFAVALLSNLVLGVLQVVVVESILSSTRTAEAAQQSLLSKRIVPADLYAKLGAIENVGKVGPLSAVTPSIAADLVHRFSHGQLQFLAEATAPDGLVAVIMSIAGDKRNERVVGYILPGQKGMLIGTLLNADGDNVTAQIAQSFAPPVPQSSNAGVRLSTQNAADEPGARTGEGFRPLRLPFDPGSFQVISEGSGPVKLTVFIDPNCSACNLLWEELQAVPDYRKRFTVRWVPLGVIKPTSLGIAAAILKSGNVSALVRDETLFDHSAEEGGLLPIADPSWIADAQSNNLAWQHLVAANDLPAGTPTIIVNDAEITIGVPPQKILNSLAASHNG